jgi:argininosuccinate lyase
MSSSTVSESQVSRRLTETTAEEVCEIIYRPRLAKDFAKGFKYLTDINAAHVLMLHRQGLVQTAAASAIARALLEMEAAGPDAIELDPQREDAYFNYEAHLIGKIGKDVGGRLHTARSRNDILATIDRLKARDHVHALIEQLVSVRRTILGQATRYAEVVMPGYTHLQPAQPVTYGFWLSATAEALGRDTERLEGAYVRMNRSTLGAGALAGTPFDIDRAETARLLGFPSVAENTLDAVASRDFLFEIMGALTMLATTWSRIAQDYFVWVTDEFRLIDFPDSVAGTSSIMPQKKNPVVLEYLKGRAGHMIGMFTTAMSVQRASQFSHTGDANRESVANFADMCDECVKALKVLDLVVRSARPREDVMLRRARENFCAATDLADTIVRRCDVSFRQAHHIVGAVVREAMERGLSSDQIDVDMVDRAAVEEIGHPLGLSAAVVSECLDPAASVRARTAGGPAPESVARMVAAATISLVQQDTLNQQRRELSRLARARLHAETEALASHAAITP